MLQIFSTIDNPFAKFNNAYAKLGEGGLTQFISNLIRLIIVAGGLFAFINIILAGFQYISSQGDPKNTQAAWAKINMSLIGLIVMVSSFAIAGVLGKLLLGDWSAILNPKVYGPGGN